MTINHHQTLPQPKEVLRRIERLSDVIASSCGMNVPYPESNDMSLFPVVVSLASDDLEKELMENYNSQEEVVDELRFLAENGRLLPKELEKASLDSFRKHIRQNQASVFQMISADLDAYEDQYGIS